MARYMGGPRCSREKFRRRPTMLPPRVSRQISEEEDEDDEGWDEVRDEIPDSDDFDRSSQADYGGLLGQDRPTVLEGKNGNGVGYDDQGGYDSDSEPTSLGSGFAYPFPGLQGRELTENEASDDEPPFKRARSMSIPIYHPSPFSTGMLTFQPPPLPISYGWMVRGTAEHIQDLHLSGIPVCSKEVRSKTKIDVLGEYTWIEETPSQKETYERFPAIYVPGNARTWRGVRIDTSLHQKDVKSIVTQTIRDDNTHRQPRYPYEPALRALESADRVASLSEIDIVTDADTLTQLLSFILGGSAARRVKEPFRLELKTVRNTLFIQPSHKPGSNQAGPPNQRTRHDPSISVPDWTHGVFGHIGTRKARLSYSGGHYRLVRYRFGNVVLAVRVKVDFVYEHRKDARRANVDPLSDVQPEFMPRQEGDVAQIWKTTVMKSGRGTRPADAGIASVRYAWQDQRVRMRALLPKLWFSRTPFVVDCKVSRPELNVREVSIVNSRGWYTSWERGYQNSLRRLAGLLKHLQTRTREMGGDIVLIADPAQVCFVLLTPVIKMKALPEDLVLKFWGPDTEMEQQEQLAEMGGDSTPEEAQSDLTDLSSTPSLPEGSDLADVGYAQTDQSQPEASQADSEAAPADVPGGSPARDEAQLAEEIDPVQMVADWNNAVDSPARPSVEGGGATEYEAGDEATPAYDAEVRSFDGTRSSSHDSLVVGESAQDAGAEGSDAVLNSLALQMNRPGVMQESHESLAAVARAADVEVLRGQHSLLMVDRHLTSGMHDSSDDEWPPRPPVHPHGRITNLAPDMPRPRRHAHGDMELQSIQSGSFVPTAQTPPGPSDYDVDSAGHMVPRRNGHVRDAYSDEEDDDDEGASTRPTNLREYMSQRGRLTAGGRPRLSDGRFGHGNYTVVSDDIQEDEAGEGHDDDEEMDDGEIEQGDIEDDDGDDMEQDDEVEQGRTEED